MRTFVPTLGLAAALFVTACVSSKSEDGASPESPDAPGAAADPMQDASQPSEDSQLDLNQELERLSLAEQKRSFLVDQYMQSARDRMERLELEQAEIEVARALELAPDNLDAKELQREIGSLLGRSGANIGEGTRSLEEIYLLKKQQAEIEAQENVDKARLAMSRGEFDAAVVDLTLALDIVTLSPYSGQWDALEAEARQLLEEAKAKKQAADVAAQEEVRRETIDSLREQERTEKERRQRIIANLLDEAIAAFRGQKYDQSIELADRVLRHDPRNERALDIRDTAFRKGRDLVNDNYLRRKREQYAKWQEEMDELRIPYQGVITLPDEDHWRKITELRARRPGLDLSRTVTPAEIELRARLSDTRIPGLTIDDEESLTTTVEAVRIITGLPIVVDPAADQAAFDEGAVFDFSLTNPLSVEKALNLLVSAAGPEVTWTVRHDAVLVTTREKARGELITYNHDIQDLIFGLTDFLGPRIDRLRLLDDIEDDDGGGPFGGVGERPTINEPDDLATLVQENVAVGTWEDDGITINVEGGNMIIVHTPEVQLAVRRFLEELRRFSASLVTIESKFLVMQDAFLQEIGVDWRGLDNSGDPYTDLDDVNLSLDPTRGLDNSGSGDALIPPSAGAFYDDGGDGDYKARTENFFNNALGGALSTVGGLTTQFTFLNDLELSAILTAVEKSQNVELINDQVLSVHNTQRAYVNVVNQQAYVQDFDVEVAQFQAIADPQVNVLTEGIVLDVRPTIQHNRQYLTLEIQPTVAKVLSLTDFSTTLGGQTAAVTLQLPEIEVQSVFTTAVVPDGGSILIGGLSRLRNIERRAEVPWLANIPIVGFFFKEEGYDDEKESLMIMITAWITDVKAELAKIENR